MIYGNIREPLHEQYGTFNRTIPGALLTHISAPIKALLNLRKLTNKKAVIISTYAEKVEEPVLMRAQDARPIDWWIPSKSVIPKMLSAAVFSSVEETGTFLLKHHNRPPCTKPAGMRHLRA